jgi:glucose-6-phosphate dehydrogenase assembly protein OpcA
MPAVGVHPEQILRELRELWTTLAQDQADAGGVLRACAMTLVVTAGDSAHADRVRQTLGTLMHNHPSRAIIIREPAVIIQEKDGREHNVPDANGAVADAELNARVFAECWMPFGRNQQICSEGIEITPDGSGNMSEVARFLVPLRAPDLPLVLWRRGATGPGDGRYDALLPLADKIIFDTRDAPDAHAALAYLRGLRAQGHCVADLHWTRLTGWREVVAHLFDDRALPPESVTSAAVRYSGDRLTTCALYFAAWIRSALPQAGVSVELAEPADTNRSGIAAVEFESGSARGDTAGERLSVRRVDSGCVEVTGAGRNYHSTLPPASEESLMREELGILGRDPVYEKVLGA